MCPFKEQIVSHVNDLLQCDNVDSKALRLPFIGKPCSAGFLLWTAVQFWQWPVWSERLRNRDSFVDFKNCEVLQEILWLDFRGCGCWYACSQPFRLWYTHMSKMQNSFLENANLSQWHVLAIICCWVSCTYELNMCLCARGNTFHMRPSMAFVSRCHTLVMHSGLDWTYTHKFLKKVRFSVLSHFAGLQRNNVHVHNNLRKTFLWTLISWPCHRCLCPSCYKSSFTFVCLKRKLYRSPVIEL